MIFCINHAMSQAEQVIDARSKGNALWSVLIQRQRFLRARGLYCFAQALPVTGNPDVARMSLTWLPRRRLLDQIDLGGLTYTIEITVNTFGVSHFAGVPGLPRAMQGEPSGYASLAQVYAWGVSTLAEFEDVSRQLFDARFPPTLSDRAIAASAELFARLKGIR